LDDVGPTMLDPFKQALKQGFFRIFLLGGFSFAQKIEFIYTTGRLEASVTPTPHGHAVCLCFSHFTEFPQKKIFPHLAFNPNNFNFTSLKLSMT
jgi:hypothetical protein